MNPVGVVRKRLKVNRTNPAKMNKPTVARPKRIRTRFAYHLPDQLNHRLNGRKNHPKRKFNSCVARSARKPEGRSKMAHRAGLRVSELNALMTVEIAMVRANCR